MKKYYSLEMLADIYRLQDARISDEEAIEKAKDLHRQLNTLDISWARSNRRFYTHNQLQDFLLEYI